MAGQVQINRITQANIYLDGNSMIGRAEEVSLGALKNKMAGHKALGMVGEFEFFTGIDKLEGKIKWNSFYADNMTATGDPTVIHDMQVRTSVQKYGAGGLIGEVPMVVFLRVAFKDVPLGNFKQHDNVETEVSFTIYYVKSVIDGQEVLEFDVFTNRYKVNGTDILSKYRANLGLD
jgi:P2 family phage contractile tail tube protein